MEKISFVVVGSGWRSEFYARIAGRFPEIFDLKYILCRSEEKAKAIGERLGAPATASEEACVGAKPDFVVVAVNKDSVFEVARHWARLGFPVLMETPAGVSEEELIALWDLSSEGAVIRVAEQYFRYPLIASGFRALSDGLIGEPDSVELSLVHDYHAASLIRRMLGLELTDFTVTGRKYVCPVEETDSRLGPVTDGTVKPRTRVRAEFAFENGKRAFYDFDGVQYHSFIRSRHIDVRGVHGQWNDTVIRYTDTGHLPGMLELRASPVPGYEGLMTPELAKIGEKWNPFVHMETAQDEYAIATLLWDMGELVRTGREFYSLAEALEDAYMWLRMHKCVETGQIVRSEARPWKK